ncbi:MDN1 [Lepeophtheirus salmonis]|uniref:Midasin n=1 Tax=Lepeophtheirus salmonis TaxID=72036 RepID=A0A7R8H929_LEPSM|nr:MDN1 [Lepeophtheirus salmonis]CAF2952082.1 MDN1 [Lepeophtheirus salmonis]
MEQEDVLKFNHSPYHISLNAFSLDEISSVISSLFSQKLDVGTCTKMVKTYEIISKMDSMSRIRRNLSLRDLIKWCERISLLTNRDDVFFNGIDSLCQWIPNKHIKLEACHVIGRFVNYNQNEISHLLDSHYPKLILSKHALLMGRATLHKTESSETDPKFALTKSTSNLLEFLASAVGQSEPVLLIGETGVGKTSTVQYLCSSIGKKLRVVNMSQQSDNSDLLGAYKPVDTGIIVKSTRKKFEFLFAQTFSAQDNRKFLRNISLCVQRVLSEAIENGEWILLDEINLAESETLECLTDFISKEVSAVSSPENPELSMNKHPDFRIFACMNPPTDIGKANLPPSLRNQFTEYFINEPDEENELIQIVSKYLKDLNVEVETVQNIVDFYLMLKVNASKKLCAGNGVIPVFSLRNIVSSFTLFFLTELDTDSYHIVLRLLINHLVNERKGNKFLKEEIPKPIQSKIKSSFVKIEGYWIHVGENSPSIDEKYILTKSVRKNLKDISRIVSNCDLPVLIQGETSVGKTSLITYLANASGNHCYRINNHEHTDIQEYIGTYTMDDSGLFSFKEGVLVGAMRRGDWIILDELNLAPTEVLEALNRVLDDNRELFIAETQTLVKAHKNFRLFATQNPAGIYGGRKVLSRAFRNRFIQLNFEEVPSDEIETIVEKSCDLPRSMSKKMVKIMTELQALRRSSAAFEGKRGYITLRDLFRWGRRFHLAAKTIKTDTFYDWNKHFAEEGYMVLVSRIRRKDEEDVIKEHIEKITKIKLCDEEILTFTSEKNGLATICEQLFLLKSYKNSGIVWTHNAQRMAILLLHAIRFKEPVLLVGETGCGPLEMKEKLYFSGMTGPLIQTMKNGDILLVDEISLADDSVIERMNSVLEPSRKLLLAEKISEGESTEEITAKSSFQLIATMNPGGDFGKKELSPALRNRFFEVWCQCDNKDEDLHILIRKSLQYKFSFSPEYIIVDFFKLAQVIFKSSALYKRFNYLDNIY